MRIPSKIKISKKTFFDVFTISVMTIGLIAMFALILFYVRPIKLAEIKVPVATDKASYYPEQEVGGIFFGETFHSGEVRILREVFCSNYRGVIKPPPESAVGDFFSTQSRPRKLEGTTIRIGNLPADVPIGSNCVIQFTNVYDIQTPFGVRHEEVQYYTQNFSIVAKQEREQRDAVNQEARQQQLQSTNSADSNSDGGTTNTQTNNSTTNNITVPPSEPVTPPEKCTINLLGIKAFCN
jgi:hypothetical protein